MEWISFKDRLPTNHQKCIFLMTGEERLEGIVLSGWFCMCWSVPLFEEFIDECTFDIHEVSHWMPLPEPPKENI